MGDYADDAIEQGYADQCEEDIAAAIAASQTVPHLDYRFLEHAYMASIAMAKELEHVEVGIPEPLDLGGVQATTLKTDESGKFVTRRPAKEFLEKYGSAARVPIRGITHIDVTIEIGKDGEVKAEGKSGV